MKHRLNNLALVLISVLATFMMLEVGFRAVKAEWGWHNHLGTARTLFQAAYRARFDPRLGWVPREGIHPENYWKTQVTILEDGLRSNGDGALTAESEGPVILAVGDSFTFGDQVANGDTWPAFLERQLGTPVLNGGVFGYGLDQSYLRLLDLVARYRPQAVIVGLIPDDVSRCGLAERTAAAKPYFEIGDDGDLLLREGHLPATEPEPSSLSGWQEVLGYSFFVHRVLRRAAPQWWMQGSWQKRTRVHDQEMDVACRIFAALAEMAGRENIDIYLLLQYEHEEWLEDDLTAFQRMIERCVVPPALRLVDSLGPLRELQATDPDAYHRLYIGHMSPAGNEFIASLLAEALTVER